MIIAQDASQCRYRDIGIISAAPALPDIVSKLKKSSNVVSGKTDTSIFFLENSFIIILVLIDQRDFCTKRWLKFFDGNFDALKFMILAVRDKLTSVHV